MNDCVILLLPQWCDAADASAHWWRLSDGELAEQGSDDRWREWATRTSNLALPLVALAPVATVRLDHRTPEGQTDRQQLAVARAQSIAASMAEGPTVHGVAGWIEGRLTVAVVANATMLEWLDWLTAQGTDPEAIVPSGLLLPLSDRWRSAVVGSERMLGRDGVVAADEPALRDALVGDEAVTPLSEQEISARLVALAANRPLNLRTGRFARRHLFVLDWRRLRELAALAMLIPLIGLVMAVVMIFRLEASSDRLDAQSAQVAATVLGREVAPEAAASALDLRIGETPGASGSPFPTIAAVYRELQQVPGSSAGAMGWRPDGTLTVSLAATRAEDINRILAALQRSGYRVTATSGTGANGQAAADVTIRSAS